LAGHPGRSRYADRLRSAFGEALTQNQRKFRSGTKPAKLGWKANKRQMPQGNRKGSTVMFGTTRNGRDFSREISEIEQLLRQLEARVGRVTDFGTRAAASGANHVMDAVSNALGDIGDRFRDRFRGSSMTSEATRLGNGATKLGQDALHRIAQEVEHRPLLTLAVAIGVGYLAGMAGRRD
jgi:hypothetical protein